MPGVVSYIKTVCIVVVNKCIIKCGESDAVECEGDPFGEAEVNCICKDASMEFVEVDKLCLG